MDLFKKIVSSMGPMIDIVTPQKKKDEEIQEVANNAFVIFVMGALVGFAVCILLIGQNIITITKMV